MLFVGFFNDFSKFSQLSASSSFETLPLHMESFNNLLKLLLWQLAIVDVAAAVAVVAVVAGRFDLLDCCGAAAAAV